MLDDEVRDARKAIVKATGCTYEHGGMITSHVLNELEAEGLLEHPRLTYSAWKTPYG